MQEGHSHLATVEPIDASEAKRVINLPSLLFHNAAFIVVQTGWIFFCALGGRCLPLRSQVAFATSVCCY